MTNEEKSTQVAIEFSSVFPSTNSTTVHDLVLAMAEWKDQHLEKKKTGIMQNPYSGHCFFDMRLIDEIINELFPESEETDNSDDDE